MDKVIATVNDKKILERDIEKVLSSLSLEAKENMEKLGGKQALLENMINSELLYQHGKKINIDKEDEFIEAVEFFKKELTANMLLKKIYEKTQVTDEEIKEAYENNKNTYKREDKVTLSHILVYSEDKIMDISNELKEGLNFEQGVEKYSMCKTKSKKGVLGTFPLDKLPNEFRKIVEQLEIGQVSQYFMTAMGFHIVKLNNRENGEMLDFKEVMEAIKLDIYNKKATQQGETLISELRRDAKITK